MEEGFIILAILFVVLLIVLLFSQLILDYINRNKEKVKYLKIQCEQLGDVKTRLDKIIGLMEKSQGNDKKNQPLTD